MSEGNLKKGFSLTIGAMFAMFVVFIVLPFGACVGCTVCAGAGVKMEETKKLEEIETLGPEIVFTDIVFKLNDSNQFMHKISYKFVATNKRDRNLVKNFDIKYQDKDGLEVDTDLILGEAINAGESKTITGSSTMSPEEGANVVSMWLKVR
jgi:hypothetical protein